MTSTQIKTETPNASEQTHEQKKLAKKIPFNTDELRRFYYNVVGLESLELERIYEVQKLGQELHSDVTKHYYRTREGEMKDYTERFIKYMKLIEKLGIQQDREHIYHRILLLHRFNLDYGLLYLHLYAFLPAIELLADEQQYKYWVPLAKSLKITGSYVQTELGHGSDVQGLQTTATYDPTTKEIVFHSPTIESTKFWPGGLGKTSTHIVLYARLISNGKDYGVQAFIVQIRDMETHKPLTGIEVGDCGNKIALISNDNGYLRFNQFRQPKSSLLTKYVELSDQGEFKQKDKNSIRLAYGGMLKLRVGIVSTSHYYIAKMATIATRYSFMRRQFESKEGPKAPEALIMSYQMQQFKIIPAIAASWTLLFVADSLFGMYQQYEDLLKAKDKKAFQLLGDTHALVSGFKAVGTWSGEQFGEILKQSCGGHGYLQISGLTRPHLDFGIGVVTAEGDNTVMMQQTCAHLLKMIQHGKIDADSTLFNLKDNLTLDQELVLLYELRYKNELKNVALKIQSLVQNNSDFKTQIWNEECQTALLSAGRYYIYFFAVKNFSDVINGKKLSFTSQSVKQLSPELQKVMQMMFRVYATYYLVEEFESFYINLPSQDYVDYFNHKKVDDIKKTFKDELQVLGMSSIDIVEGWDFKDEELLTVLGKKATKDQDQLYADLLNTVRKNPINQNPIPKGYNEFIRPILLGKL
eukprot:403363411